ncbi:protealysin inhibitor emfourin [Nocardia altamirensis]|uniref:protealysin inhibitor emfourin n=1 Tax=Nocardia altamirensis TaxID=472158 RepID=UPI0008401102|nr:protealysin inhibitor emfourin [Nocardia altamirensis]
MAIGALLLASTACRIGETGSAAAPPEATSIEVNQTGGFAGAEVRYTVDSTTDNQRRTELLNTVSSPQFQALQDSYTEPNGCRDTYSYAVTATYRDGTSKHIVADECGELPQLLTDVIAGTKEIGHRQNGS